MRLNAGQRKVIEVVLVCAAALLLLGLVIDAAREAAPDFSREMVTILNKYGTGGTTKFYAGWSLETFLLELIRSPRLYIVGLLVGGFLFMRKAEKP